MRPAHKKGMILLQVLVMTAIFLFICVTLVSQSLQSRMLKKKAIFKEDASSEIEGVAAKVWACLSDERYPPVNSCSPTGAQQACVPSGADVDFTGIYPSCRLKINSDKR